MIDFTEVNQDGEDWELFSRDFLQATGLFIETPPARGADGGRDISASEILSGHLGRVRMTWMVSCKHYATSNRSVSEGDEPNILERVRGFNADGFIGVYSTIASAGLTARLEQLRTQGDIKDFRIFDRREIENRLVTAGFSSLMMRFFPQSYVGIKPIHHVQQDYIPINCAQCGKDLLEALFRENHPGNVIMLEECVNDEWTSPTRVTKVFCACKEPCDRIISRQYEKDGKITGWIDLQDLAIPMEYLSRFFAFLNNVRDGRLIYTDEAFRDAKSVFVAMAQKTLRRMNDTEWDRYSTLRMFDI